MTQRVKPVCERPRSRRIIEWPSADQFKWKQILSVNHVLLPVSDFESMSEGTRESLEQAYGIFLDHIARQAGSLLLVKQGRPARLVVHEHVQSFVRELSSRVSSVTRYNYVHNLRRVAGILDPTKDLFWLSEIERDLALLRRPKDKRNRIVPSGQLLRAGFELMKQHRQSSTPMSAIRYRNGLMVALLSICPIRLGSFADLNIGRQFRRIGSDWWILLDAESTKTRRADERLLPECLNEPITRYVEGFRPILKPWHNSLWVSLSGGPLSYDAVQVTITKSTQELIGVAVSPHLFRSCAASTAYLLAPELPDLPSALLHHWDAAVTQRHYNKAPSYEYAIRYRKLIEG